MAPDLPEKLLGIDIDPVADQRDTDRTDRDEPEERRRVIRFDVGEHQLAVPVDDVASMTDAPTALTEVPRTPAAIEGVTDLRGEITAILELRTYFPSDRDAPGEQKLLILDCPDDEQPAAFRVDNVRSVDAIPERNVLQVSDLEGRSISADPLEHPLVTALLERTRRQRPTGDVVPSADVDRQRLEEPREVVEIVPLVDVDAALAAAGHRVAAR
ncbi:chemotaxis protein CheW [Natrarchaeobaculum aegyptiacum]|uniref:CheW-like domain-containing protein n=1 Tax=Natrarchaeobaculum aegyptiacum TaxID=745377 RepID=A0A2Z2HPK8_9EURY|nr:chemotaxis protein CheW [Natrarchaeobaculum aegyptiacum]ARS88862.1 hypothetical protein B1756_03230 [Natrarchaeobaculum aegyptiacum]